LRFDGHSPRESSWYETRQFFGARLFRAAGALRGAVRPRLRALPRAQAREEAVRTLEDVTHRVHAEYDRKLGTLEQKLLNASGRTPTVEPERLLALERERPRRSRMRAAPGRRANAVSSRSRPPSTQLEKAHVSCTGAVRRSDRRPHAHLIDRVLTLEPRPTTRERW